MAGGKYKAVFLDFYGTVADGDAEAVERVCARVVADYGMTLSAGELAVQWGSRFFESVDACHRAGFRTLYACECDSLVETCLPLCGRIDPAPYADELADYMRVPPLHPEAKEVLRQLTVPVCCVSNADSDHLEAAIAHHQLAFAEVVCSEDVRFYKPESEIFERALARMGLDADEVVHVGDSLHSDVQGARAAGIDAIWVCRDRRIFDKGRGQADHKISSLKELQSFLV
ncbi:MAG: HAD family hydrolase [Phycisphaerae bacterium]